MTIRIGIGGWTYEPWRGTFYPEKWPQKRELEYAASKLTAIEINGTYYSSFKPASWRAWGEAAPAEFEFAVKASRYCTNRKVLAEAGESIGKFTAQGVTELGDKLGPILWQFMATKKFDAADFAAFLKLLPPEQNGVRLKHAVQVRHNSFAVPDFVAMCRDHNVAIVFAQSDDYPALHAITADFVYARLETAAEDEPLGYAPAELDRWARGAKAWADGGAPSDLDTVGDPASPSPRDVYLFMIAGAKVRNPAAAMSLIEGVGRTAK